MNKLGGLALSLVLVAGGARAQPAAATRIAIESCASGPPITIGLDDERAVLAEGERDSLVAEMTARYPQLGSDGFNPQVILMWHKTPREWLYVSLQPDGDASGTLCFTASFVAAQFRITPTLIRAYAH